MEGLQPVSRSRVSNGRALFAEGGDGRSAWARRWRDVLWQHMADLGGEDLLSEAQKSLCRRLATLAVQLEQYEAKLSEGQEVDLDLYGRLAGHHRRIAEAVGIKRQERPALTLEALSEALHGRR